MILIQLIACQFAQFLYFVIQYFCQRLLNCSHEYQEDDDKTLALGTEEQEEVFKTCSEPDSSAEEDTAQDGNQKGQDDEDMFRDGSDERPYEDR